MLHLVRKLRTAGVLCLLGFAACTEQTTDVDRASTRSYSVGNAQSIRPEEAGFFTLAEEIPGFGGYSFDASGNIVAFIKDVTPTKEDMARNRLERVLQYRGRSLRRIGAVTFRNGQYSFPELAAWRDLLSSHLLGQGIGVRSTDADEARNRVVVGVGSAGARAAVQRKLVELGIPNGAVVMLDEDPVAYEGESLSLSGISTANGELYGGMAIRRLREDNLYTVCTMGFYAVLNGVTVGVSNSHCSRDRNSSGGDGTRFETRAGALLGFETHDRSFHDYCPKIYNTARWCRNADAMLFDAAAGGPTPGMRKIARYALINPGSNQDPMYQQIDVSNPFIITYRNASRAGEWINKAGISTGWTQGQISATCKDVEYWVLVTMSPNVIQCQHEASYGHANGDSGSPVFALVGDAADLRGIHWGYYPQMTGMKIVFSPLGRIEQDFGTLLGLGESGGGGGGSGECDPEAKECF